MEDLREFLIGKGICPECKETGFLWHDGENGEVICRKCAMVVGTRFNPVIRCSGIGNNRDRHDAPENQLCFGKDLGNPDVNSRRNGKALYQVIGQTHKENLGIRAIQVRNECMASQETNVTQRMKNYLSGWCKQFGWGDHVLLSNALGFNARWVGTILTMMKNGKDSKELSRGIFVLNVQKFFGREKALEVAGTLKVKKRYIAKARGLIHLDKLVV